MTADSHNHEPRKSWLSNIDLKGWLSILIGASAVWIAYMSFAWQRDQAEGNQPTEAGPENTIGTESGPGITSGSSSNSGGEKDSDSEKADNSGPGNKEDKKNKGNKH